MIYIKITINLIRTVNKAASRISFGGLPMAIYQCLFQVLHYYKSDDFEAHPQQYILDGLIGAPQAHWETSHKH